MGGAHGAVRVAADDDLPMGLQPLDHPVSNPLPIAGRTCPARYAAQAEELQPLPHVPRHHPAHGVEPVALEIDLMPVNDEDPLPGSGVVEDQPFVRHEPVFLHPVALAALDVVIAHDEVQPALPVKSMQ